MNVDNVKLIEDLLTKAQGERTLRQFADEVGINASSLSRMRSGLFRPRVEVLEKIVEHSAKPGAVSLQELIEAFDHVAEENRSKRQRYEETKENEKGQRATVLMGLLMAGYSIQEMRDDPRDKRGRRYADVEVVTNALSSSDECTWAFLFLGSPRISSRTDNKIAFHGLRGHLDRIAAAFYFGDIRLSRYSIVTTDRGLYTMAKKEWSEYRIPNEISLILVDTFGKDVLDEFVIPTTDGRDPAYPFKNLKKEKLNGKLSI